MRILVGPTNLKTKTMSKKQKVLLLSVLIIATFRNFVLYLFHLLGQKSFDYLYRKIQIECISIQPIQKANNTHKIIAKWYLFPQTHTVLQVHKHMKLSINQMVMVLLFKVKTSNHLTVEIGVL